MKKTLIITLAAVGIIAGYMLINPADYVEEPAQAKPIANSPTQEATDPTPTIEELLAQAEELFAQGSPYAAWDLVLEAEQVNPHDTKMLQLKVDLAVVASDYATKLKQAAEQGSLETTRPPP